MRHRLRARDVHATDLNEDTLALARAKIYAAPVTFERRDAYVPHAPEAAPRFDAGLAGLWLSHVDLGRMDEFLRAFHSHLAPGRGGADARPARHRGAAEPAREPHRRGGQPLRDAAAPHVFGCARLEALVRPHAAALTCRELRYFWLLEYVLP